MSTTVHSNEGVLTPYIIHVGACCPHHAVDCPCNNGVVQRTPSTSSQDGSTDRVVVCGEAQLCQQCRVDGIADGLHLASERGEAGRGHPPPPQPPGGMARLRQRQGTSPPSANAC
eukprot:scaffold213066_cov31-Tisochrysis_lutea.AAC.3